MKDVIDYGIDKVDHSGESHGRLTLLKKNGYKQEYFCSCNCGRYTKDSPKLIEYKRIKSGNTKSCGCLHSEILSNINKIYKKSCNTYDLSGEYGIGYTSKGEEFYFDLEDYDKIKDYCWCLSDEKYVVARCGKIHIKLHKLLLPDAKVVDHRNHKKFDNRKSNLRIVSHQVNMFNKERYINNTSGITGVSWDKQKNKWRSQISHNKKRIYLGVFDNFDDAVKARKEAEEKYFGEFSYDNSIKKENV